jgi:transposase-like protein
MAKPVLTAPHFHNEEAAFAYVERHLWPEGPVCPHCGNCDGERIGRLTGKSSRPGLRKCYVCRKTFTVRIGSIFEDSHFPLHLWLQAIQLITASKEGITTRQIQRAFNCSMKTAWFLTHRIREIMKPANDGLTSPMGGEGETIEAGAIGARGIVDNWNCHLGTKTGVTPKRVQSPTNSRRRHQQARQQRVPSVVEMVQPFSTVYCLASARWLRQESPARRLVARLCRW